MKRNALLVCGATFVLLVFSAARWADEGMWLLDSVSHLPLGTMKTYGLELAPKQIYNPDGPSLKDAILLLSGGTASFVSADGLILTNHHVAYGGIQSLSSVQADYLKNGFLAKSRTEELSTTYTAQILKEMRDVTGEVLSAVSDTMSPEQRSTAVRAKIRDVERTARGSTDLNCRVSETFNGLKYYLYIFETLTDIRLIYAPPTSIGNFGGEVDNWVWPRHTGDFSFMRAYVGPDGKPAKYSKDNVPYHPAMYLPFSTAGVHEGSFAMIMGYPGRTYRYREAAGVQLAHDETLPTTIDLYKARIDVINAAGANDRAVQIKYASKVRGIANMYKKYIGILEGMTRGDLLNSKRNEEREFEAFLRSTPSLSRKYGHLLPDLEKANAELRTVNRKGLLLQSLTTGLDLFRLATRFHTYAGSYMTDSTGRVQLPPERERTALTEYVTSVFRNFDLGVEKGVLTALIMKDLDFPPEQQITLFRDLARSTDPAERQAAAREYVEHLYDDSRLSTPEGCRKLMEEGSEAIDEDALVAFAISLEQEQAPVTAITSRANAALTPLRQRYVEAWLAWKDGSLVYPDADRSIRLTYGQVKPFRPRDAVQYDFVSTLSGVMEKADTTDPFRVPDRLKELWQKKNFGRYADPVLHDVPVAFIADLDITNGNSGSPVLNGKGEIIGCAFDGNWEGVVGDYLFQDSLNRTIAVDARYILFVLDKFSGAQNILNELAIR